MKTHNSLKFSAIAVSGKIATGTSTLSSNLHEVLGWKYVNAGKIQREYDRKHDINENQRGSLVRPDSHEEGMEAMAKKFLQERRHIIYEAWLAGFVAQSMKHVLKVLLVCSSEAVRIDRVAFRDKLTIKQAQNYIKQREEENLKKWKKLYGDYDFYDKKYFDIMVDTYASGPNETVGKVLDALGYRNSS